MKIELRNVKVNNSFSEETICFKGDLYINDIKRGYCSNDGHGGCTSYRSYKPEDDSVISECEVYCKSLPMVVYENLSWEQSLEGVINDLVDKFMEDKEKVKVQKKMEKDMLKGLIFNKDGNTDGYGLLSWKGRTLNDMLSNPVGRVNVENTIKKYKEQGYQFLNTNLPIEML